MNKSRDITFNLNSAFKQIPNIEAPAHAYQKICYRYCKITIIYDILQIVTFVWSVKLLT